MGHNLCQLCTIILTIALINPLLAHETHDKTHQCIHDDIDHKITQQFIKYTNHPLESNNINTRKLLSQQYTPIRIRPYYDPLLINTNTLSIDQILYIKSLISTSIHYLEQFVKVIPISEPLLINRCQRVWHYTSFTYNVCPLSDYTEPLKCQFATIPESHIAESWYYDPFTFQSYKYKDAGRGVADADLIIYVTYGADQCSQDGKTLAWASICNLDQYGRPIAGTINFCPQVSDNNYWKFDVGVTLHEIMHLLVMSNSLFQYFYNTQTHQFYGENNVVISNEFNTELGNTYIITDKVRQTARNHFGCNTLIGAPLENTGDIGTIGSHWEGKYLQSELMCGTMYSAVLYLSSFTFALMEDTGWYGIDYEYNELFTWGANEGCNFFTNDCVNNGISNFQQYWCTSSADNGCSYDYTTIGSCMNQVTTTIPHGFNWYTDSTFGGPQSHDYCAFRVPKTLSNNIYKDYEQICWDSRGNAYKSNKLPGEIFGIDSRCVEINDAGNKVGYCFKHECIGWDYYSKRYNGIKLLISDGLIDNYDMVTCLRSQSLQYIKSTTYSFTIKCPNIDSICGHSTQPFNCFWGKYSDVLHKCICSVGYIGNDCSIMDTNRLVNEALVATNVHITSPQFHDGICITNSSKHYINGYYKLDAQYEGLSSYAHSSSVSNNNFYLYYFRYLSQWSIGNNKGDLSIFAYCTDSLNINQIIDVTQCKLWAIWNDISNGWIWDYNLHVTHCTPTQSPTPPTYMPSPSIHPTHIPTLHPIVTNNPTHIPSNIPSNIPSYNPIHMPSYNPIHMPSYNPIHMPSYNPTFSPVHTPTNTPVNSPTLNPISTTVPSKTPSDKPTDRPTDLPTKLPSHLPTELPTHLPTELPTHLPTNLPTISPTYNPTITPTNNPSFNPTHFPTFKPTHFPTFKPTYNPSFIPTYSPTVSPTFSPLNRPTRGPTSRPTISPTKSPTNTNNPTSKPSINPTSKPSINPTATVGLERVSNDLNPSIGTKSPTVLPINKSGNKVLINENNSTEQNGNIAIIGIGSIAVLFVLIGFGVMAYALIKCKCCDIIFKNKMKRKSVSAMKGKRTFSTMNASKSNITEDESMILID